MKILLCLVLMLIKLVSFSQVKSIKQKVPIDSTSSFKIIFTYFNHAERIFNGITTYTLTDSYIKVEKSYMFEKKSDVIFTKRIKNNINIVSALNNIKLDSLDEYYTNYCVMLTSGDEYFLNLVKSSGTKHLSLHHYYLKEVDSIVNLINLNLPKKYQLEYLSESTRQDCRL